MSRPTTGLARPIQSPTFYNYDEFEFLERLCFDLNIPKAAYTRSKTLPTDWRARLKKLRRKQAHLPQTQFRREGTPSLLAAR